MKGYAHPEYAASLAEFGAPRQLPQCCGWILDRPIPGSTYRDAMGSYPLFACRDWSQLHADMEALRDELVTVSMVTDPFGPYDLELLRGCFDRVIPFKEHFVADLRQPIAKIVSSHHRYYTRKALKNVRIEVCTEPACFIDEWTELYAALTGKFNIRGLRAFSRRAFEKQLMIPGATLFRAVHEGEAVAAHMVFEQDDVCYGHLVGATPAGQELLASYALYWTEIEYFADRARWFDWGGVVGTTNDRGSPLAQFKRGWSTGTRLSYLCGRVFDSNLYEEIVKASGVAATDYFPAYRKGEFG